MLSQIKKLIPVSLKKLPWFLFRSPQRKLGYYITYRTDIYGFLAYLANYLSKFLSSKQRKLQSISICTGLKNRSHNYLNFVLESVLQMDNQDLIELSVFDCNSQDVPDLEKKIREKWKGKLKFTSVECGFARAFTFNRAIAQASHELIFASDADMTLPKDIVVQCNKFVSKRSVWFPICFYLDEGKPAVTAKENGNWNPTGKGMFAAYKWQFEKAGRYDEKYKSWGWEDTDLWEKFYKKGFLPIRNRCKGLFHHYHPNPERF